MRIKNDPNHASLLFSKHFKCRSQGSPRWLSGDESPAFVGHMGSSPDLGRCHLPWEQRSPWAPTTEPTGCSQLLSPEPESLRCTAGGVTVARSQLLSPEPESLRATAGEVTAARSQPALAAEGPPLAATREGPAATKTRQSRQQTNEWTKSLKKSGRN